MSILCLLFYIAHNKISQLKFKRKSKDAHKYAPLECNADWPFVNHKSYI